jgi:hypothetical protein
MNKRGAQQQRIGVAAMHKCVKYIQTVALVEARHPLEQAQLAGQQVFCHKRAFSRRHMPGQRARELLKAVANM